MAACADTLRAALHAVHAACPGVEGSAIVSADGILLTSMLADEVHPDRFGAMCATLLALAGRMAGEVGRGPLRQLILDGEYGPVLLTQAGDVGVLAIAATKEASLGRLILTARNVAGCIHSVEETGTPMAA